MLSKLFRRLLGSEKKETSIRSMMNQGAIIIDVRSQGEFASGHIKGAKNIPLQQIIGQAEHIKKMNKPVIVCCASGMRSSQAQSMLEARGVEVVNGGGWTSLNQIINSKTKTQ